MSLFYDPLTKKPKPWVFVVFIIIPIALFILSIVFGRQYADKKVRSTLKEIDIFEKK
ncbi:MAG TPA: hypothetical protein PLH56_05680 [Candidatus Omnitrophota bacterium]|nr:hypothetical protein [Candidatus Omnitrophota bacterium]HPN88807.1 hypothetical protein [Candidatus Omnitrophota bacterium]